MLSVKRIPADRKTCLGWRLKTSTIGVFTCSPLACSWANAGDSETLRRMNRPTATSARLRMNGTRQPHARNSSSGSWETTAKTAVESIRPIGTPSWGQEP